LLQRLIWNDPDLASGDERLKVWPTNANQSAFREVMHPDGPPAEVVDDPNNTIHEAYAYFAQAIREWTHAELPSEAELDKRHKALRIVLSDLLQIVTINLESGDNAQVIFETLNARGTPLLAMDLVKNALFHRAQREGADVDGLNSSVWEPELGREYWRERVLQGRLRRPRAELFLMHWLTMRLAKTVPATELFSQFRVHVMDGSATLDVEALIRELCGDAAVMRQFDELPSGTPEAQFFQRLGVLDITTVIPVALLLYRSSEVISERRRRALLLIESWLIRRAICGYTTRGYNRLIVDLLKRLQPNLERADETIAEFLASSEASSAAWPGDEALTKVLTTRQLYGWVNQRRIVMVLAAVELELRKSNKVEDIYSLPANLTIEHVMPQQWREHWPIDGGDEDTRDAKVQLLGNLTMTSGPLNSSLSNAPWSTKRPALVKHSLLLLNQEITTHDDWNEQTTDARGAWLSQLICQLWPRPDQPTLGEATEAATDSSDLPGTTEESTGDDAVRVTELAARRWSDLDRIELRGLALELAREALEKAGYAVTGPFDQRSNILAADTDADTFEVHVRTSRNFNYTFLTKANFQPADARSALVVVLVDEEDPRLYLIPSRAWETADDVLVDREYDDLASDPEWGLNLSRRALSTLERFALGPPSGRAAEEVSGP
jgi:hypothetical protein